jgi:hypothetical protein
MRNKQEVKMDGIPKWVDCLVCKAEMCHTCAVKDKGSGYINFEDNRIDVDIYLDVDGVLFTVEGGIFELRDGVIGFLYWLVRNFKNCYWQTCWGDRFNEVLHMIYGGRIAEKFKDSNWNHGIGKHSGIQDWNRPFAWIEDGISEKEMEALKEHGCESNYIHVPYKGEMHKLYEIKEELKHRFNIKEAEK